MDIEFNYTTHIAECEVEGTAYLAEQQADSDGYINFRVEGITFKHFEKPDNKQLKSALFLESAFRNWVREQIEQDEAVQAAWDEHVGNPVINFSAPYRTVYARNGAVA